jgi:predicted metal-dependent hydrolase
MMLHSIFNMPNPLQQIKTLDNQVISYSTRVSTRARRYRIMVGTNGVELIIPHGGSINQGIAFLSHHSDWVLAQLKRIDKQKARTTLPPLLENSLLYQGRTTPVKHVPDASLHSRAVAEYTGRSIRVRVPLHSRITPLKVAEAWMRQQARPMIEKRVVAWAATLHVSPRRITIRDQRTRWGSCSSSGTLSFNWRLIMPPQEIMDYVIVHELAHMLEPNHSRQFWLIVARYCPDYKKHRVWLRRNASLLHPLA